MRPAGRGGKSARQWRLFDCAADIIISEKSYATKYWESVAACQLCIVNCPKHTAQRGSSRKTLPAYQAEFGPSYNMWSPQMTGQLEFAWQFWSRHCHCAVLHCCMSNGSVSDPKQTNSSTRWYVGQVWISPVVQAQARPTPSLKLN